MLLSVIPSLSGVSEQQPSLRANTITNIHIQQSVCGWILSYALSKLYSTCMEKYLILRLARKTQFRELCTNVGN